MKGLEPPCLSALDPKSSASANFATSAYLVGIAGFEPTMPESESGALPLGHIPKIKWGERWDSNPRQPVPQTGALPTELRSPYGAS